MHSLPILSDLEENSRKIVVCDSLLALVIQLGKEEYEINDSISDKFNRLPPNSSKAECRDETVRSLLISLLDNADSENGSIEGILPYLSVLFKGMIGRCLCLSSAVGLLGIGPGDIVAGDIIINFAGVEQSLFFRREDGKYQVLGDGLFTRLYGWINTQGYGRDVEILLV
jgi:hypothetical protein